MSLFTSASLILTPNGYKSQKLYSIVPSTGDGDLAFTRATTATRVNSKRLIESVGINIPRLDYSDGIASWLLEPQRTNLETNSENLNNWNVQDVTISSNAIISPDGTQNADKIISNNSNTFHAIYNHSSALDGVYTFSFYAKKGEYNCIFAWDQYSGVFASTFNLDLVTSSGADSSIESIGNGWYRCKVTFDGTEASNSLVFPSITPISSSMNPYLYAGDGKSGAYVWGAQLELGSYATSYIPTVASMVTRNADVVSNTGIGDLIGQREGTLYVEVAPMSTNLGPTTPILYIQSVDGTSSLMLYLDSYGGTLHHTLQIIKNGSTGYISDGITITNTNFTKLALRYKVGEISLWKDGVKAFTYTDPTFTTFPFTPQFEKFLTVGGYGSSVIGTKIKGIQLYKTALTDAQCTALTTYNSYAKMAYELNYILQ